MRTVTLNFDQKSDFENIYLSDFPNGGLFIETTADYFLSERLRIVLRFPEVPEGVELKGDIVWRRSPTKRKSVLKPGVGVSLDEAEKQRLKFLLGYARGETEIRRGRSRRIPADFRVDFTYSDEWHSGKALNISREGLFILTDAAVSPNTAVQMKLYLEGGTGPEDFLGKVAWHCDRKPETGIGVEFQFKNHLRRQKILQYMDEGESLLAKRFPSDGNMKLKFGMTS